MVFSNVVATIMEGDLYDEFGNYIGPELESESEGSEQAEEEVSPSNDSIIMNDGGR